jgi:hypothetical protein
MIEAFPRRIFSQADLGLPDGLPNRNLGSGLRTRKIFVYCLILVFHVAYDRRSRIAYRR